jgi:hypothetical protein
MNRRTLLAALAVAAATLTAAPAFAQGTPQTVTIFKVDPVAVATGFRASKVIGSNVVNETGTSIGKIDDVIISSDGKAPYAVLSVGGFLGVGSRLVLVRYQDLNFANNKVTLNGATKDNLAALPEFKYAS